MVRISGSLWKDLLCGNIIAKEMETYSLEEEEGSDIFITQKSQNIIPLVPNFDGEGDEPMDVVQQANPSYWAVFSDISDDDNVDIPCSQVQPKTTGER